MLKNMKANRNNARLGAHEEVKIRKYKHGMDEDNLITTDAYSHVIINHGSVC